MYFRRLIYLVFPEIGLSSTQEGGTKVTIPSFSCSVVFFLWKLIRKETNKALFKDLQDAFSASIRAICSARVSKITNLIRLNTLL